MRIDRLRLTNYRGFATQVFDLNSRFTLFVGDNATGKTSILDALTVAMDSWFIGMKAGESTGGFTASEVRFATHRYDDRFSFEPQYPTQVEAWGVVMDQEISWSRELVRQKGRTTTSGSKELTYFSTEADRRVREGIEVDLPLLCSYGAERLWWETPQRKRKAAEHEAPRPSRFDGYRLSTAFEIQETPLLEWIKSEISVSQQKGKETGGLAVMKTALLGCVEDAVDLYYDPRIADLVLVMAGREPQVFDNFSAGQRVMVTLIGDLVRRAIILNPHMGREVLERTVGIVAIDELDLHLHPKWQRRIISDLKRTFRRIQFVATTHSPQMIGEALPDEIRLLENWSVFTPGYSFGVDSNRILQELMHTSSRNEKTQQLLSELAEKMDSEDMDSAKKLVARLIEELGEGDPEVTRANTLISMLESTR